MSTRRALPSQKPKELLELVLKERDNAGIIDCSTTKQVDQTSRLLQSRSIRAAAYHAKLDPETRRKNQDDFLRPGAGHGGHQRLWHGHRQAQRAVRHSLQYAQGSGELLSGGGPRGPRRGTGSLHPALPGTDVRTIRFFIDKEMEADNGLPADVKAEAARKAEERLKYMSLLFHNAARCLRSFLLNYFGETAPPRKKCNCSCCRMSEQAAEEMQQQAARRRPPPTPKRLAAQAASRCRNLSEGRRKLLAGLYALRKWLAAKQNVPAYMMFNDATPSAR